MSGSGACGFSHHAPGTADDNSAWGTAYIASPDDNTSARRSYLVAADQPHPPEEPPTSNAPTEFPIAAKGKLRADSLLDDETAAAARQQDFSQVGTSKANAQNATTTTTTTTTTTEPAPPPLRAKAPIHFAFPPSSYLDFASNLDPRNIDLNKIGILYEYSDAYFVVLEVPQHHRGAATLRRGFMRRDVVGAYLRVEWASLFKERIGDRGRGASASGGGRWHVYSALIQQMRVVCSRGAREVETQVAGRGVGDGKIKRVLEGVFDGVVDEVYAVWRRGVEEKGKEGDEFMREFMVLGE